jgi:DUF2894 family protein
MTEKVSAAGQPPLETLQTALDAIKAGAAHRFDPPRFRYIESMLARALAHAEPVKNRVGEKALEAFQHYQQDFNQAQSDAASALERIVSQRPDWSESMQALFEAVKFRELHRHEARLQRDSGEGALTDILGRLEGQQDKTDAGPEGNSIEDMLLRQEHTIVNTLRASPNQQGASEPVTTHNANSTELKSARRFRQSTEKLSTNKRLGQALQKNPEDSGPLNPQRLIVSSLATMRELSPQYTSRFVAYIDTLLWLEQAGVKAETD